MIHGSVISVKCYKAAQATITLSAAVYAQSDSGKYQISYMKTFPLLADMSFLDIQFGYKTKSPSASGEIKFL